MFHLLCFKRVFLPYKVWMIWHDFYDNWMVNLLALTAMLFGNLKSNSGENHKYNFENNNYVKLLSEGAKEDYV